MYCVLYLECILNKEVPLSIVLLISLITICRLYLNFLVLAPENVNFGARTEIHVWFGSNAQALSRNAKYLAQH